MKAEELAERLEARQRNITVMNGFEDELATETIATLREQDKRLDRYQRSGERLLAEMKGWSDRAETAESALSTALLQRDAALERVEALQEELKALRTAAAKVLGQFPSGDAGGGVLRAAAHEELRAALNPDKGSI